MQFKRHDDSKDLASDCPTLTVTKPLYLKMITGQIKGVKSCFLTKVKSKAIHWKLENSFAMFKRPDSTFPIVTDQMIRMK